MVSKDVIKKLNLTPFGHPLLNGCQYYFYKKINDVPVYIMDCDYGGEPLRENRLMALMKGDKAYVTFTFPMDIFSDALNEVPLFMEHIETQLIRSYNKIINPLSSTANHPFLSKPFFQ